jgi:hypothetical protein
MIALDGAHISEKIPVKSIRSFRTVCQSSNTMSTKYYRKGQYINSTDAQYLLLGAHPRFS